MYGLSWIWLAAQIAFWTSGGASAGAAAGASGRSLATDPGVVRFTTGVGAWYSAPPAAVGAGACAWAATGNSKKDIDVRVSPSPRRENKPYSSFVGLRG